MRQLPVPGDVIDEDYVIVRELGRGAMGVVYLATQSGLARQVALKLMSPALDEPEFRGRFEREARTLAKLYSPYVVSVHDFGEHDGWMYLTTPFLPLGDLAAHIAKGLLEPDEALRLLSHAAAGLAAAHAVGIVHRDIKPSNILLAEDPDGLRALLADFGIARDTSATTAEVTSGVIGTYAYMPPERFGGAPADARTDVYALGCVLWAMLHGRPPFVDPQGQLQMREVLGPRTPVYAGPAAASLNSLLGRCLAKDPAHRFADGGELLAALNAVRETPDAPVTVVAGTQPSTGNAMVTVPAGRSGGSLPPVGGPIKATPRRRLLVAGIIAAVVLLVGGVVAAIALTGRDGDDGPPQPPETSYTADPRLVHAPQTDVCRDLEPGDLDDTSDSVKPAVPCSDPHTAYTFDVYPTDTPGAEDGGRCIRSAVTLLGDKPERYFATALSVAYFVPDPAEAADGASWVRCDLILYPSSELVPLPDLQWENAFLDEQPSEELSMCTEDDGAVVLCKDPYRYAMVAVPRIEGYPSYPNQQGVLDGLATDRCPEGTVWYHAEAFEWNAGFPYLVCFA
jgi:hypothetical protein